MRIPRLVPALALAALPLRAQTPPATQVTLPLAEYERLKKGDERPSLTVVDTLRLGGRFRGQGLTVSFTGRSAGKLPAEKVLTAAGDVVVFGCEGDGILSRAEGEGFLLTPLAPKFDVRCRIGGSGSDRLELTAPRGVLHVESAVADGELVAGAAGGEGGRSFSLVRLAAGSSEVVPPSATGRYRITLRPDESRFVWQIDAHNPNRARHAFDVTLRSGEHVRQVDAQAPYEVEGPRYRFELPPGDTTLTLTGTLDGTAFVPPVEASVQYVLVESDPLLRATVNGAAKRVSPDETGLPSRFRGAQAFLLGKGEKLAFAVKKLETLHTTSFAVKSVRHVFFLPAEGAALGESLFVLDNQGASELTLPKDPTPIFAAFGGEPVVLTKGAKDELTLPLAHGVQQLTVQHLRAFVRRAGFARVNFLPPRVDAAASSAAVEVRYPHEWLPLVENFAGETRFRTPESGELFWTILLALFTERALWFLGIRGKRRLLLALLLGLAALFAPAFATLLLVADLALTALVVVALARRTAWSLKGVAAFVLVGACVILFAMVGTLFTPRAKFAERPASAPPSSAGYLSDQPASVEEKSNTLSKYSTRMAPTQQPAKPIPMPTEAEAYQGLPARVDIPAGENRTYFSREMLPGDVPRPVRVLAISSALAFWLRMIPLALALAALVARREELRAGLKERLAQAQAAASVPPPVPEAGASA